MDEVLGISGAEFGFVNRLATTLLQAPASATQPSDATAHARLALSAIAAGEFGKVEADFTSQMRAALPRHISPDAPTPLWRAVDEALTAFGSERELRSVILVLSDGKDSGPLSFTQRYTSQAEIIERARRDAVMVYGIGMRRRGGG